MSRIGADLRHFLRIAVVSIIALSCWYSPRASLAQDKAAADPYRPLPDVATIMQSVEAHQKTTEARSKDYIYTSNVTEVEVDGKGKPRKTETTEADIFYVAGARLRRVVKKDGKDLTPDEKRKEDERIDKEIAKAKEKSAKPREEVTYARFLELGSFSNERRVQLHGRSTIALDYTGDPKARTHNPLEGAIHEMAGTVWVDEEDQVLSRVEGHFANNFKVGAGLMVYVEKNTSFWAEFSRINSEVWLPSAFAAEGSARVLLFFGFHGHASGTNSNYRKFKTNTTILPGLQEVDPTPPAPPPP